MRLRTVAPVLALITAAVLLPACSEARQPAQARAEAPKETEKDLLFADPDEAKVNAAVAEARRTLPAFWARFERKDPGATDYVVKVAFPVKDGGREHIWAHVLSHTKDEVRVRIANDPVYIRDLAYGQEVSVQPDMITDWAYEKAGKLYGHFTTRAMMDRATPEQRAEVEGALSPTPVEPEAR